MVLIPTRDQLVPPSWQYQLGAAVANPTIVELVGVRHEAPWTHADRLAEEIATRHRPTMGRRVSRAAGPSLRTTDCRPPARSPRAIRHGR